MKRLTRYARPTSLWVILVAVLGLTLLSGSASASASDEASFIAGVNQARASAGLPPLQADSQLTSLSRTWSAHMRDGGCGSGQFICHASPLSSGVTHNWGKLGENVGTGGDVGSVMQAFINSPGHYRNIVDPEFTHVGVGVVWQDGRLYTTHRFMKLQGAAPAPTPTTQPPATTAPPATPAAPAPTTPAAPAQAAPPTPAPPTAESGNTTSAHGRVAPPADHARVERLLEVVSSIG